MGIPLHVRICIGLQATHAFPPACICTASCLKGGSGKLPAAPEPATLLHFDPALAPCSVSGFLQPVRISVETSSMAVVIELVPVFSPGLGGLCVRTTSFSVEVPK
jgi:hypothetical protein